METETQLTSVGEYLKTIGLEEKDWWSGGTDQESEGDWVWSDSLSPVGEFIWSPGQPDGGDQQNCLYLNPIHHYRGRDDDCHVRKQPLCQLYLPTTTDSSSTTPTTLPSPSPTTSPSQSSSTTSDPFERQKCCDTVRLESSGLISSLKPDYVGLYTKIVTEITNKSVYHKEDKFLFYLDSWSDLESEAWVVSTSMSAVPGQTIIKRDSDRCPDNTGPGWEVVEGQDWARDETAVVRCEVGCETDEECNVGLSGECSTDQWGQTVHCQYCEEGQCKPGCGSDHGSDQVSSCPAPLPVCNPDTHQCQPARGSTLLETIVFTSDSCQGCTREGVNMTLTGNEIILPQPKCRTVDLDHPDQQDFQSQSTFVASGEEQDLGWANCYKVLAEVCGDYLSIVYVSGRPGGGGQAV